MRDTEIKYLDTAITKKTATNKIIFYAFCLVVLLTPQLSLATGETVLYGAKPNNGEYGWEFPPLTKFEKAGTNDTYEAGEYIFVDSNSDSKIDRTEPCIYPLQDSNVWGVAVPAGSEYKTTDGEAFNDDVVFQNDDGDFIYESNEGVWVDNIVNDGLYQAGETVWYSGSPAMSGGEVGAAWNTWYTTPKFDDQNGNRKWEYGEAIWQDINNDSNYNQGEPVVLGSLGLNPAGLSEAVSWSGAPAFYNDGTSRNYRFELTDAIWNNSYGDGLPWPEVKYTDDAFIVNPTSGLTTTEAGGTDTFTVRLNTQPAADVTIDLSSDDTTEGTVSLASLTFTSANWSTPRTVTMTGVDDNVADGNQAYTILINPAVSTDPNYNGLDPDDAAVTNTDNDTSGITVDPNSGLTTTEAGGTDTFTVVLNSEPLQDVAIDLFSDNTREGTASPASLTFSATNWNNPQTVTVTGEDDSLADGNQAYAIHADPTVSTDADYDGLTLDNVMVTNTDNDNPGITVNPTSGLTTTEAGGTDTFTVVLNTEPTRDVTIDLSSGNINEGTVSPASLTFTPANWIIPQTVIVTGVDDSVADGNQTYTILINPIVSTDPDYDGLDPDDVTVTNVEKVTEDDKSSGGGGGGGCFIATAAYGSTIEPH